MVRTSCYDKKQQDGRDVTFSETPKNVLERVTYLVHLTQEPSPIASGVRRINNVRHKGWIAPVCVIGALVPVIHVEVKRDDGTSLMGLRVVNWNASVGMTYSQNSLFVRVSLRTVLVTVVMKIRTKDGRMITNDIFAVCTPGLVFCHRMCQTWSSCVWTQPWGLSKVRWELLSKRNVVSWTKSRKDQQTHTRRMHTSATWSKDP